MQDPAYMDALKDSLLAVTSELRPLVRRALYDPPDRTAPPLSTSRGRHSRSITVCPGEILALMRVAMPFCMSVPNRRENHAELLAAWATFAAELVDLNRDAPLSRYGLGAPRTIAAALDLMTALRAWIERMRWVEATTDARVKWPKPVSITPLRRLRTSPDVPGMFEGLPPEKVDGRATWRKRKAASKAAGKQREMLLALAGDRAAAPSATAGDTSTAHQASDQAPHRNVA